MAELHTALREQARHLAQRERKRPKQASLRRAVSTAYYALFHRLTFDAARFLIPGRQGALRAKVRRAFVHGDMKTVARAYAAGSPPQPWSGLAAPPSPELRRVAKLFVELQQKRHEADYDTEAAFSKSEVVALLARLDRSFSDLDDMSREGREVFGVALLLNKQVRG